MLKIFIKDEYKDLIRKSENIHEIKLKEQLKEFGIVIEFETITPHGLTLKNSFENNLIEK